MIRRLFNWMLRLGGRSAMGAALRLGSRSAIDTALSAAVDVVPKAGQQSYTQVFNVQPPITVYIRGSHCRVTVRRAPDPKVILQANTYRAFGLELAAEQDHAGVYIVAKRKPVVGQISRADFTVTVPPESHLTLNLTPGDVVLQDIDGMLEFPP
jgi:hypothetical protein